MCYWNISGFNNLYNSDVESQNFLLQNRLICLSETWIDVETKFNVSIYIQNYVHIYSLAFKDNTGSKGRASSGISSFLKKDCEYKHTVYEIKETHIILDITSNTDRIRICVFYWRPQSRFDELYLNSLENLLHELTLSDSENCKIICMGDFNARIGSLNNIYEEYIFDNSYSMNTRNTRDQTTKSRGLRLTDITENAGFVVFNGRSRSDPGESFTYMAESGNSYIDLVWVSESCLQFVTDFPLSYFSTFSNHFLCTTKINRSLVLDFVAITRIQSIILRFFPNLLLSRGLELRIRVRVYIRKFCTREDIDEWWRWRRHTCGWPRQQRRYGGLGAEQPSDVCGATSATRTASSLRR